MLLNKFISDIMSNKVAYKMYLTRTDHNDVFDAKSGIITTFAPEPIHSTYSHYYVLDRELHVLERDSGNMVCWGISNIENVSPVIIASPELEFDIKSIIRMFGTSEEHMAVLRDYIRECYTSYYGSESFQFAEQATVKCPISTKARLNGTSYSIKCSYCNNTLDISVVTEIGNLRTTCRISWRPVSDYSVKFDTLREPSCENEIREFITPFRIS